MKTIAIIAAAGNGTRAKLGKNKLLYEIGNIPLLLKTITAFVANPNVNHIIITVNEGDEENIKEMLKNIQTDKQIDFILGGKTRFDSISNALTLTSNYDITLIHDGARPFVSQKLINDVIEGVKSKGAIVPGIPLVDTIKRVYEGVVVDTPIRSDYVRVQTPQGFNSKKLLIAYSQAQHSNYTDDSMVYEEFIDKVHVIDGEENNIKITNPDDFEQFNPKNYSCGIGYDVHELVENRDLILGGIKIDHYKGLLGHSDADVLTHSIMDSLLTASNNRDIGVLFPDTDDKYKGISSIKLLQKVYELITSQGYKINNISSEIIAQKPKLSKLIPIIQENLAKELNLDKDRISIAATTSENLGITGEEKAIAVYSIASLKM